MFVLKGKIVFLCWFIFLFGGFFSFIDKKDGFKMSFLFVKFLLILIFLKCVDFFSYVFVNNNLKFLCSFLYLGVFLFIVYFGVYIDF